MGQAWYNLDMRGRRIESICKQLNTKIMKIIKKENITVEEIEMALSYIDRFTKLESVAKTYVEEVIGLKKFLARKDVKEVINEKHLLA